MTKHTPRKTGADIFHMTMVDCNVKCIFGYNGGAIVSVFDAIYQSPHFKFILAKHEQGAGHMAQGYARVSGRPGVVLVTSGPGSSNTITPILDATADGTPLVVFCGQVPQAAIGTDAFQEIDMVAIAKPCAKWAVQIEHVNDLGGTIRKAFSVAISGRPGPVVVMIPSNISKATVDTSRISRQLSGFPCSEEHLRQPDDATLNQVASLINKAQRPVVYAGQGLLQSENGAHCLKELAWKASIPVATTLLGLGGFDEADPKALHMLGMHGAVYANKAVQHADLILALGARFDARAIGNPARYAPAARAAAQAGRGGIVQFEISPRTGRKAFSVDHLVVGDVGASLARLLPRVHGRKARPEWTAQIQHWREKYPLSYTKNYGDDSIPPQTVIELLSQKVADTGRRAVITTGVGQHQIWTAQHYQWRQPRSLVTSGGLGTMGFGLPAAIGTSIAHPSALVIDIDDDASFCMSMEELSTATQFGINVKIIILNNNEQGMVTEWQTRQCDGRYSHSHQLNPDFVKLAEAMGVEARETCSLAELSQCLDWLLQIQKAALLNVRVRGKVDLLPALEPLKALDEQLVFDPGTGCPTQC